MIEFKNVYKQYVKDFFSLYNFSCTIDTHSIFIGDFFDGTSTIMRLLSKIDRTYKGDIFINSVNLDNIKNKNLNMAYLPQTPVLFKNKSVFNNLYFPLKIRSISKIDAKTKIDNLFLDFKANNLHCAIKLENKTKDLSLSEQKIISLIRSVIREPKYVLLENFFEDLEKDYIDIALHLINKLKQHSIIVACEKDFTNINYFNTFNIIELEHGSIKK